MIRYYSPAAYRGMFLVWSLVIATFGIMFPMVAHGHDFAATFPVFAFTVAVCVQERINKIADARLGL